MSRRIQKRFIIGLWVFGFAFLAGIAQGRLGYDYRDNLIFYGRPVDVDIDSNVVTWKENGFATKVKFSDETRKAEVVSTYSKGWTPEKLQSWIQLQIVTFGKDSRIGEVKPLERPDKQTTVQAAVVYDADNKPVGHLSIMQRVFTNEAIITITDIRKK